MRKKRYVFYEFDHSLLYHIYIYLSTCDGTCAYDHVGLVQDHFFKKSVYQDMMCGF